MTLQVIGPILLPHTPDCDYQIGELPLSTEQVNNLAASFKQYNIIDYEHQFTNPDNDYFMRNIGKPLRLFTVDKEVTFTDVSDTKITVPKGTAWLESEINDPIIEKDIKDNIIVAYSVTVAEKEDAKYFMDLYNNINNTSSYKSNEIRNRHAKIIQKRTLIKDLNAPEMFTVSVVKFPCVYKAKFCKHGLKTVESTNTINKCDNMTDEYNDQTFMDNIKTELKKLRNSMKQDETIVENTIEDTTEQEINHDAINPDVKKFIEGEIASIKEDLLAEQKTQSDELLNAIASIKEDKQDETTVEDTTADINDVDDVEDETTIETPVNQEEEEEEEEKVKQNPTKADNEADATNETTDNINTPIDDNNVDDSIDINDNNNVEAEVITAKSSVGKAFSKKAEENRIKNQTAQPTRKTTLKHEGGQTSMKTIHERDIIKNIVKGDGTAIKSAANENRKIIYATKEYNLVPYYQHKGVLNNLNKAGKHVFAESFSEEETNKAILSTELFAQYVREMVTPESIFDNANYQTVYGEEAPIRRVRSEAPYTSQDGHLAANYYFDSIPDAAELKHEKDVIRPVTQRDLFTISDRQLRNNVFGDDLLDVSLETIKETFYNGVYAARILGDTDNEGQQFTPAGGSATDIDMQFTRKDGWIKQAGVQLSSETDFDANKILDLFDTMYYSLPEYAQEESNYAFFVPSQIRRAYYNHFIKNSRESKLDLVSEQRPLYFNNIPILTSKTLSSAYFRNMLTGGDAKIFLSNPQNTLLGVGRSFGIEPERHADTSSTYYYLTLDTDAKFIKPEEAVVATITADDYATLPVSTEITEP